MDAKFCKIQEFLVNVYHCLSDGIFLLRLIPIPSLTCNFIGNKGAVAVSEAMKVTTHLHNLW